MKITKSASGKKEIRISKSEWENIGKQAGWMKQAQYDDNFGHYNIEDDDDLEFYEQMQRESVEKKCKGCGRTVRIRPQYAYCNSCAEKIERGEDVGENVDDW